jgi:formylglycine-generating enzyme
MRAWASDKIARVTLALLAMSAATGGLGGQASAARPQDAIPEALAQVDRAIHALAPLLRHAGRRLQPGSKGTLEAAIRAYAPLKPWAVSEGIAPAAIDAGARCPPEMGLVLGRFCVDRFEASIAERTDSGTQAHSPFALLEEGRVYLAESVSGVIPQAYISAKQAEAACREADKRLCAAVEWRAACGGSQGFAYPYGGARKRGVCNDSGRAPMQVYYADKLQMGFDLSSMNDPRLNQLSRTLAKSGEFAACINDYGLSDMVGNLHEWTSDANGTFQGGYYLDTMEHGEGCAYRTIAHGATYHDYSTGFRCCKDAEPRAPSAR